MVLVTHSDLSGKSDMHSVPAMVGAPYYKFFGSLHPLVASAWRSPGQGGDRGEERVFVRSNVWC